MTRLIIITMLRLEPQYLSRSSPRPLRKIVGTSTRLIRVLEPIRRPSFLRDNSYANTWKDSRVANKIGNLLDIGSVEKKSRIFHFFPRIKEIFFLSSVNDSLVRCNS